MHPKTQLARLIALALAPAIAITLADTAAAQTATAQALPTAPTLLPSLTVAGGTTKTIDTTTKLQQLKLGSGAALVAPAGKSLTLTVGGIGLPIKAGTYCCDVVLTVTDNIDVSYSSGSPGGASETLNHVLRTGVYIDNGARVASKSVAAIVSEGTVSNSAAKGVYIESREPKFNGFIVTGLSNYTITDPTILLYGNGGNDFVGFGAGIKADGYAKVKVDGAYIYAKGAIRTAMFAGGNSTLDVNNSFIDVRNGTLPSDYSFTVATGKLMEVPWVLGLAGNNRATNLVGSATATYTASRIRAQGWGALSTDDTTKVRLKAKDSRIEVTQSGYGAYSIGDSVDTFDNCRINVADMALIMANGAASGTFTNGTVVNSGRFGVMMHSNSGGTLIVNKGSVINSKEASIQLKSSSPTIIVNKARLVPANGLLIQAVVNDDPYMTELGFPASGSEVNATFRDTSLVGDIVNGNTVAAGVTTRLYNTRLLGAITQATTTHQTADDGTALSMAHPELYKLVGAFTHSYASTGSSFPVDVTLGGSSEWIVNRTSYLTKLTIGANASVVAASGKTLTMTVDGVNTSIVPGRAYSGAIVLTVS
ncbi:right-handed parallel beta-helix repeat-containing protein [Derxia gummosa]|uniref:Right-handed parallel beta-helix repeat-containing protein n=1 Tax=Derxia gummosa DSM 723 TaxID=1121388 RepID=A0A8B6X439_9BURK|nr:hypothetical protein [Derxia gummosa]